MCTMYPDFCFPVFNSSHICSTTMICLFFFWPEIPLCSSPALRQVLYISDDNEIRSLDPSMPNWRYEQIFQGDANVRIDAMDLHVMTNRIYWTNWHTGRISSYDLPSASSSPNSNRNRRQSDSRVTNLEVSVYMLFSCLYDLNLTTWL